MDNSAPVNRLRSAVALVPLFNKCSSNTYYVPGRGPNAGDTVVSKHMQSRILMEQRVLTRQLEAALNQIMSLMKIKLHSETLAHVTDGLI